MLTCDRLVDPLHPTAGDPIQGRSINVYVRRLRSKLGDSAESPRHLLTVGRVGYRLAGT